MNGIAYASDRPAVRLELGLDRIAFWVLAAFVFVLPWDQLVERIGGFVFSRWIGALAVGVAVFRLSVHWRFRRLSPLHYLMLAFMLWSSLSVLWSTDRGSTLERAGTYSQLFILVGLIWELARDAGRVITLMQGFVLGAAISAADTVRNAVLGRTAGDIYGEETGITSIHGNRFTAGGFNANDLGVLLALTVPMSFYLWTRSKGRPSGYVYWVHLVLSGVAIILTGSRGATVTLLVSLLMVPMVLFRWTAGQRRMFAVAVLAAVMCSIALVPASLWQRMTDIGQELEQGTLSHRTQIWTFAMDLFREHPLVGVGSGALPQTIVARLGNAYVAHNTFISVLVELGAIGAMLLSAMLAAMILCSLKMPSLEKRFWMMELLCWIVGVSTLTWEYQKPTWVILGLLAAHAAALSARKFGPQGGWAPYVFHAS